MILRVQKRERKNLLHRLQRKNRTALSTQNQADLLCWAEQKYMRIVCVVSTHARSTQAYSIHIELPT